MNLTEISKAVSKETGVPTYKVLHVLSTALSVIRAQILKAQIIKLKGLLTLYIDVVPERNYYNVIKEEHAVKPRHFVLKVIQSNILKKQINAKKTY